MNASLFVYTVKKQQISVSHSEPISLQKGWAAGCVKKHAGRAAGCYKMFFFGPQGPGMQARLIFGIREKSGIWATYTSLQNDMCSFLFFSPKPCHFV
jgi:hypothetical protein